MAVGKLSSFLPYGAHYIDEDDCRAVVDVLKSDRLTCGRMVDLLESQICDMTGAKYTVSCANGTAGLHLASLALDLKAGDKVIVPTITFLATANAPRWCGADIIFADVDPVTGLMRVSDFNDALERAGDNVKAVFPVHLAGHICPMKDIYEIAKQKNITVIEDACHALGSDYLGKPVGSCTFSDMTMFSFHPVKNAAMGEGGVITTNNPDLYKKMIYLRGHGMERNPDFFTNHDVAMDDEGKANPWYYEMKDIGLNYRLTDMQCALGISQLKKLPDFKARRSHLRNLYCDLLKAYNSIIRPMETAADSNPCWHIFVIHIDFTKINIGKADIMRALAERNIGVQVHYIPVHMQPYYRNIRQENLPSSMQYYESALTLPLHVNMSEQDVQDVVDNLIDIISN